jgi:uncharacterized protein YndB with AHSA1/START domain
VSGSATDAGRDTQEAAGVKSLDRIILSSRVFDASPERLWNAFRDPRALSQWWGPEGFTNAFHRFDLKPGGEWRFTMRGPDGAEYSMHKIFVEVEPLASLVFDHPDPVHGHRMFVTFSALEGEGEGECEEGEEGKIEVKTAGKTILTWKMRFDSAEEADRVRPFILIANEQNFDRLADYLSTPRA